MSSVNCKSLCIIDNATELSLQNKWSIVDGPGLFWAGDGRAQALVGPGLATPLTVWRANLGAPYVPVTSFNTSFQIAKY